MTCEELEKGTRWIDLALGELDPDVAPCALAHIEVCSSCRQRSERVRHRLLLFRYLPHAPAVRLYDLVDQDDKEAALPSDLKAALLTIPDMTLEPVARPAAEHEWLGLEASHAVTTWPARLWAWLIRATSSRRLRAPALALVAAAALLLVIFPPERTVIKGPDSSVNSISTVEQAPIGLELVALDDGGALRRVPIDLLAPSAAGAVVRNGQLFQPVLRSPELDLKTVGAYWVATAVNREGMVRFLDSGGPDRPIARVPDTRQTFALPTTVSLTSGEDKEALRWRLFVLLTATPVARARLEAALADRPPAQVGPALAGRPPTQIEAALENQAPAYPPTVDITLPWSLLTTPRLSGIQGVEATLLVEVR